MAAHCHDEQQGAGNAPPPLCASPSLPLQPLLPLLLLLMLPPLQLRETRGPVAGGGRSLLLPPFPFRTVFAALVASAEVATRPPISRSPSAVTHTFSSSSNLCPHMEKFFKLVSSQ